MGLGERIICKSLNLCYYPSKKQFVKKLGNFSRLNSGRADPKTIFPLGDPRLRHNLG
jgi:hypothetical protein